MLPVKVEIAVTMFYFYLHLPHRVRFSASFLPSTDRQSFASTSTPPVYRPQSMQN